MFIYSGTPSIAATFGEQNFGRYIGVAFIEGLFCTNCSFGTWVPGRYTEVAFIQGWLLRGVPLYWFSHNYNYTCTSLILSSLCALTVCVCVCVDQMLQRRMSMASFRRGKYFKDHLGFVSVIIIIVRLLSGYLWQSITELALAFRALYVAQSLYG